MELLILVLLGGVFVLWVSNQTLKQRLDRVEQRLGAWTAGRPGRRPKPIGRPSPRPPPTRRRQNRSPGPQPEPVPAATYAVGYTKVPERIEETEARAPGPDGSADR